MFSSVPSEVETYGLKVWANTCPVLSTTTSGGPILAVEVFGVLEDDPELLQAATPRARMVAAARAFTVL